MRRMILTCSVLMFTISLFLTQSAVAAGLLVAEGRFGGVLEQTQHNVTVTLNNGIAVTEVEQVFRNTEDRVLEALYTFPVPKGASVANFSMWINGKEMIGEVVEKKRAREIYESYKQTRVDPGLLEQVDYKTFEMRIFPIAAGAEQRVRITYYQTVDVDHDFATYVYPLATVSKPGLDAKVRGKFSMTVRAVSEIPMKQLRSSSHGDDFVIAKRNERFFEASMELSEGSVNRDFVLGYDLERPKTGIDFVTSRQGGEDGFFMLTLTAGKELEDLVEPMDYVFILDVSGSMGDDGKLITSTRSIASFIKALGPNDRFEVMSFNVSPTTMFNQLRNADDKNLAAATKFLEAQKARGGTALRPALKTAFKYADLEGDRPLNIVIVSDGMTEQNSRRQLLGALVDRPTRSRVFCIGVGNEVNRPLLNQLAKDTGGLAAFVSQGSDFDRQSAAFRRKLTRPVAENVKISFSGGDIHDVEPAEPGALYHGTPIRMYGRYRDAGQTKVTLSATVFGRPITKSITVPLPREDDDNPQIERMWALARVDRLLADADRGGSRDAVLDEIVRLGEGFSIVTEYTSFIVLENGGEYERWKIDRRNALRIERDRAARAKVNRQLAAMREASADNLGPSKGNAKAAPVDELATAKPTVQRQAQAPKVDEPARRNRSFDFDIRDGGRSSGGGGGAIDPITLGAAAMLGAAVIVARRRRKRGGK